MGVIAYGARKLRSRAKSAVQPFQSGTYILRPSGSLYRFVQAETVGAAALWGDVERMAQASVVAEWIVRGEEEGRPDEALYRLVRWALDRLLAGDEAETVVPSLPSPGALARRAPASAAPAERPVRRPTHPAAKAPSALPADPHALPLVLAGRTLLRIPQTPAGHLRPPSRQALPCGRRTCTGGTTPRDPSARRDANTDWTRSFTPPRLRRNLLYVPFLPV
ncbi:MAG: recombination protein O N-terminal domain-containing protein [Brockia lithotrophica]|nr:recombination protein O N-terminal domain-containing protein [Brockia lithotrophica]